MFFLHIIHHSKDWNKNGTLNREINYYSKFLKKGIKVTFVTYGQVIINI